MERIQSSSRLPDPHRAQCGEEAAVGTAWSGSASRLSFQLFLLDA